MKIDIVYTWVNGSDENWRADYEHWIEVVGKEKPHECRYFNNEELKYSLRSVEKYAPWINKIFIITNGQIPNWLDTSHPKIKIVTHDEIMPKSALPTFNSEAIECCIPNIKDLSEHFIYSNDDFFIYKKINPDYFFTSTGKAIVRLVNKKWETLTNYNLYCRNIIYSINLIKDRFGIKYNFESSHNMDSYLKSSYYDCMNEFAFEKERTVLSKFRTDKSLQRTIVSLYMLAQGSGELKTIRIRNKFLRRPPENLFMPIRDKMKMKSRLWRSKPALFCINDAESVQDCDRATLKSFLESMFPEPAAWELLNKN